MLKHPYCYRPIIAVLALVLVGACASSTDNASPPTAPAPVPENPDTYPLVRQGRYTLVELRPESAQRAVFGRPTNAPPERATGVSYDFDS